MSERDPHLYCEDILESGSAILDFVKGLSFDDFCDDRKTYSAVIREFEIIGEAVGKLPESFRERRPDVEWQDIKDFRNLLSHEYLGVPHPCPNGCGEGNSRGREMKRNDILHSVAARQGLVLS